MYTKYYTNSTFKRCEILYVQNTVIKISSYTKVENSRENRTFKIKFKILLNTFNGTFLNFPESNPR